MHYHLIDCIRVNVSRERLEYFKTEKSAENPENIRGYVDFSQVRSIKKFDELTFQIDGTYLFIILPICFPLPSVQSKEVSCLLSLSL